MIIMWIAVAADAEVSDFTLMNHVYMRDDEMLILIAFTIQRPF